MDDTLAGRVANVPVTLDRFDLAEEGQIIDAYNSLGRGRVRTGRSPRIIKGHIEMEKKYVFETDGPTLVLTRASVPSDQLYAFVQGDEAYAQAFDEELRRRFPESSTATPR